MKFYLAPMEGITGYVYRNAYHAHFAPMDKYFTPFLAPKNNGGGFSHREKNDILPEHNQGMETVPQILTNSSQDFLRRFKRIRLSGSKPESWLPLCHCNREGKRSGIFTGAGASGNVPGSGL